MKKLFTLTVSLVVLSATTGATAAAGQLVWSAAANAEHYTVYDRDAFNPGTAWQFVAAIHTTSYPIAFDQPQQFFTVTAVGFDGVEVPKIASTGTGVPATSVPATRSVFTKLLPPKLK